MSGVRHLPFTDVFDDATGGNVKTLQSDYLPSGRVAVVDQGKELIAGFTDDEEAVCAATPPVIVFGDHTCIFKYIDFPFAIGADGVKVLKPKIEADTKYLFYCLRRIHLPDTGYDRHFKYLKRSTIPLPPLAEQKRIAAVLDKADDLRGKRRQALATLDRLQRAAFMDFFQRSAKAPPITIRSDIPVTGEGWGWRLLTELGRLATGHTPDRKRPEYWNGDIPWITLSNIRELDGSIAMDTDEHTTEAGINHSSAVKLPAGTVCFSRTASVGFVTVMGREMCTSQDFVNWVCGPELVPDYLMWSFIYSRESLRSLSSGSTHKTIYFPTVERFCVLLPPVGLQRRFAQIAQVIRAEKLCQARSLDKADALFATLQSAAFAGTLFNGERGTPSASPPVHSTARPSTAAAV